MTATLPQDHSGLAVLPYEECLRLLADTPVGRVGFFADGDLVVLPVNHGMDGACIVFRTASGSKLQAAERASVVAFEVDEYDASTRDGWSVVVSGVAEQVLDDADIERLEQLGVRPWAEGRARPCWVRIRPNSVTGRRIAR